MIRASHDWGEHAGIVEIALPDRKRLPYFRERKKDDAAAYLNSGFRDWTVEDANDKLHAAREKEGIDRVAKLAKDAEKPVRITLAVHPAGDGIIHSGKRRTKVAKPKCHVWFYENGDDMEEMERNAVKGMPPKLLAMLYGLKIRTAVDKVGLANRALAKVDKPFCVK